MSLEDFNQHSAYEDDVKYPISDRCELNDSEEQIRRDALFAASLWSEDNLEDFDLHGENFVCFENRDVGDSHVSGSQNALDSCERDGPGDGLGLVSHERTQSAKHVRLRTDLEGHASGPWSPHSRSSVNLSLSEFPSLPTSRSFDVTARNVSLQRLHQPGSTKKVFFDVM